ncbi:MAG: TetR family transcriptional regulator C-terminal domain-containing protein [Paenibacillaceae bacterium]|nr:TetR family transcriptional regulator C-terminal domain-containing protein [Paenibacillaceae bacterium]
MEPNTSRTDPRVVRTRHMLKTALVELLEEMDIDKISVNRIAERATINRVTFYLHYKDIPDMMEKMADEMIDDFQRILHESPEKAVSKEESDLQLMTRLLEHIADNVKFFKVVLASKRTPIFTERMLRMLTELVTDKVERQLDERFFAESGIRKDIVIWYGASALIGTIVSWLRKDMPYSPQFLAKQFMLLRTAAERKRK